MQVSEAVRAPDDAAARRAAHWVASWAVPGLGMFNESYYIFSVGNVKPIWTEEYPSCWKARNAATCARTQSTTAQKLLKALLCLCAQVACILGRACM